MVRGVVLGLRTLARSPPSARTAVYLFHSFQRLMNSSALSAVT